jgi:hypothetical protein
MRNQPRDEMAADWSSISSSAILARARGTGARDVFVFKM